MNDLNGPEIEGKYGIGQTIFYSLEDAVEEAKKYRHLYQDYAYTLSFEVEKHEPNDFIKAEIRKNLNDYRDDF